MKEQLKYWYRKYIPIKFRDLISLKLIREFINDIFNGYKFNNFNKFIQLNARNGGISYYASNDDDEATLDNDLLYKICQWGAKAYEIKLEANPNLPGAHFYNQYPGEHYRLLAAITILEKPDSIIDIGTYTGMSSRVFLDYGNENTKVSTFDLVHWTEFDSYLDESDFNKKRITQELGNLSDENIFKLHEDLFSKSSLIFLDAPKDGYFEEKLIRQLSKINFQERNRYLILDDIRVPEMFEVWRMIDSPKIDATTFGHWSGTGIVNISQGLKIKK